MKTEKILVNVNKGQDAYSVIGNYISNHTTTIEDMIAVIQINGCITNELYMVDTKADGYFYWRSDWWEGEEDVALIDFFPVSEAEKPQEWIPVSERLPEDERDVLFCDIDRDIMIGYHIKGKLNTHFSQQGTYENIKNVKKWMPLPEPYMAESEE